MVLGIYTARCSTSGPERKSSRAGPNENYAIAPPHSAQPETRNWLACWLTPHRTMEHSLAGLLPPHGWSVKTVKQSGREEVGRGAPWPDFWWKYVKIDIKTSSYDDLSELKRFGWHFCRNSLFFIFNPAPNNLVVNLTSKLASSQVQLEMKILIYYEYLYRRELNLAISSSPVTKKKNIYIFSKAYCYLIGKRNF
jgi:hypothetical protein